MRSLSFYEFTKCKLVVSYSSPGPRQRYFLLLPLSWVYFHFLNTSFHTTHPLLTQQLSFSLQLSLQPHRTHLPTMLLIPQFSCFSYSLLYFFTSFPLITLFYWSLSPPLLHLALSSHSQSHFSSQQLLGNSNHFFHLPLPLSSPPPHTLTLLASVTFSEN
jgi:hypothetical protein